MEKESSNLKTKHNFKSITKLILKILLLIVTLKVAISLIATPKIKTNYILAYNNFSKPENYQPSHNAWEDYNSAFKLYLDINTYIKNHPDLTDAQIIEIHNIIDSKNISPEVRTVLADWVSLNSNAIDLTTRGANKPYFWYEYPASNCMLRCIKKPYNCKLAHLNNLLLYKARLESSNNDFYSAAESLLNAYRIGTHLTKENRFIRDQITGLNCKKQTLQCAMAIVENNNISKTQLEYLQDSLTKLSENDSYIPSTKIESLLFDETLEWLFLDWKWGFNSISFRALFHWKCPLTTQKHAWIHSFIGPTKTKISKQERRLECLHEKLRNATPWQRQNEFAKDVKEIDDILNSNIFWKEFGYNSLLLYDRYYEVKAQLSSLITIIAIKRFKIDNDRFPRDLYELVSKRYIERVPHNPFSGSIMSYSHTENNFELQGISDKTTTKNNTKQTQYNQ